MEILDACCDDSMIPEKNAAMQSGKKTSSPAREIGMKNAGNRK